MTAEDLATLMDELGCDAERRHGTLDELRRLLSSGAQAIVSVDSDEVRYGVDDDLDLADRRADHALVVAGIDELRGVVILADPGNAATGKGYEMPLAAFEEAWADSDHEMVIAQPDVPAAPVAPNPAREQPGRLPVSQLTSPAVLIPLLVRGQGHPVRVAAASGPRYGRLTGPRAAARAPPVVASPLPQAAGTAVRVRT